MQYIKSKHQTTNKKTQKFLVLKCSFQKKLRQSYWTYIEDIRTDEVNSPYSNEISSTHKVGKRFWSYIKNLRCDATGVAPLRSNGCLVSESLAKANILNEQYQSVFTTENTNNIPDLGNSPYPNLPPLHITLHPNTNPPGGNGPETSSEVCNKEIPQH